MYKRWVLNITPNGGFQPRNCKSSMTTSWAGLKLSVSTGRSDTEIFTGSLHAYSYSECCLTVVDIVLGRHRTGHKMLPGRSMNASAHYCKNRRSSIAS